MSKRNLDNHQRPGDSVYAPIEVDDSDDDVIMFIPTDREVLHFHNRKRKHVKTFSPPPAKRTRRVDLVDEIIEVRDSPNLDDRPEPPNGNDRNLTVANSKAPRTELLTRIKKVGERVPGEAVKAILNANDIRDLEDWSQLIKESELRESGEGLTAPRVGLLMHRPKKLGEHVIGPSWRWGSVFDRQEIVKQAGGSWLQSLSLLSPYAHSHRAPRQRLTKNLFNSVSHSGYTIFRSGFSRLDEIRVGGCPNVINQRGPFVVIAASSHGVDDDSDGKRKKLPMMSPGHAKPAAVANQSASTEQDTANNQISVPDLPIDESKYIFESVFDTQFDPGCPDRFLSAGNDKQVLTWTIEKTDDGERRVRSRRSKDKADQRYLELRTRPHFIRFNPNKLHWKGGEDEISTYVATDAVGGFVVEFSESELSIDVTEVDSSPDRQVSAICWGYGANPNMLFAGTETVEYQDKDKGAGGVQRAYRITPEGKAVPLLYTASKDEVEALALNPRGDLLASFTRTCNYSKPLCPQCDHRRISSHHELSLFSLSNIMDQRTTRKQVPNTNLIGSVSLPSFKHSDSFNESGLIVSAAWSPCGTYIAAARDDDWIDIFDHRFLESSPVVRFRHATGSPPPKSRPALSLDGKKSNCCSVPEKHPKHGITFLQWIHGNGLMTGGSDGCVRLWDARQSGGGLMLQELQAGIAAMNIGDISQNEVPLIVADEEGLVKMCDFKGK